MTDRQTGPDLILRDEVIDVREPRCLHNVGHVRLERVTFRCDGLPLGALDVRWAQSVTMRECKVVGATAKPALRLEDVAEVDIEGLRLEPDAEGYAGGLLMLEGYGQASTWRVSGLIVEGVTLHPSLAEQNVDAVLVHNPHNLVLAESGFRDIEGYDGAWDIGWKPDDAVLHPGLAIVRGCELVNARRAKLTGYAGSLAGNHRLEVRSSRFAGTRFESYYGARTECELISTTFADVDAPPIRLGSSSRPSQGSLSVRGVRNFAGYQLVDATYSTGEIRGTDSVRRAA